MCFFFGIQVGYVRLHYVIVASFAPSSNAGCQLSTVDGQVSTDDHMSSPQLLQPSSKPTAVTMTTGCCNSGVAIAIGMGSVTHSTVPSTHQHCVVPAQHRFGEVGRCAKRGAGSEKRHSAVTGGTGTASVAPPVDDTSSTLPKMTSYSATVVHSRDSAAKQKVVRPTDSSGLVVPPTSLLCLGDCTPAAVPMLWLPEQPGTFPTVVSADDGYDGRGFDEAAYKQVAPLHLVPFIAAMSQPYPCVEPICVDMATVGMEMAGGVSMATALGHCVMPVDDCSSQLVWPPMYHCDALAPTTFDSTHMIPPTGITSGDPVPCQSNVGGPSHAGATLPAASSVISHTSLSMCSPLPDPSPVTDTTHVQDDDEDLLGGQLSAESRPDVVSSNIPRSDTTATASDSSSNTVPPESLASTTFGGSSVAGPSTENSERQQESENDNADAACDENGVEMASADDQVDGVDQPSAAASDTDVASSSRFPD